MDGCPETPRDTPSSVPEHWVKPHPTQLETEPKLIRVGSVRRF